MGEPIREPTTETGRLIRERRTAMGLSMKVLARRVNVTQGAVSRWEAGKRWPSMLTASDLSREFGLDRAGQLALLCALAKDGGWDVAGEA